MFFRRFHLRRISVGSGEENIIQRRKVVLQRRKVVLQRRKVVFQCRKVVLRAFAQGFSATMVVFADSVPVISTDDRLPLTSFQEY